MAKAVRLLLLLSLSLIIRDKVLASFYIDLEKVDIEKSSEAGAKIRVNKISEVRTVCVRFLVTQTEKPQTIFYTPDEDNLVLQFAFQARFGFLRMNRKWIIFNMPEPIIPYVYNNFCFSRNETGYSVVSNGVLWYTFKLLPFDIPTITQPVNITEIITGPAGFSLTKGGYFLGKLSELYILSTSYTDEELKSITDSCKRTMDKGSRILDWSRLNPSKDIIIPKKEDADIRIVERNVEDICATVKDKQVDLLPFSMDTQTSISSCLSLGGEMFYPDYEHKEILKEDFEREGEVLQKLVANACGGKGKIVWLPTYKKGLATWVDFNNHSKEIGPISDRIVVNGNDLQNCGYLKTSTYDYGDTACSLEYCTFCAWEQKQQFTMRGLCEGDSVEDHYLLTNNLFFNGILGKNNKNLIVYFNSNCILQYTAFYGYSKHSLVFEKEYDMILGQSSI